MYGYDIGGTSYALTNLLRPHEDDSGWSETIRTSPSWQGAIVSGASLGALLASMFVFLSGFGDQIGRRRELQLGSLLYLIGAMIESFSMYCARHGLAVLMAGRIIYGLGIGLSMHAAPTYLGEMGPPPIRGFLVSLKEASIVMGILCGYIVGYIFSNVQGGWCYIYALTVFGSILMMGLSFCIPPSCRWLFLKGREDEARESLRFVYPLDSEEVFRNMKRIHEVNMGSGHDRGTSTNLLSGRYKGQLIAGVGIVILQQVTGQPSVLSYATQIFQAAGVADYSSIIVALWKLATTVSAASAVERFGRKMLLYVGCSLMFAALVFLSLFFNDESSAGSGRIFIIVAMLVYIGGYQIGFGPISWTLTSEIFPLEVRGQAVAFAVQMNFLLNTIVQFGVPILEDGIGFGRTFSIFALLSAYR